MISTSKKIIPFVTAGILAGLSLTFQSCSKEFSGATAEEYNNPKNGGYLNVPYTEQETGPGLVLIEGGTFSMGRQEQEVEYEWNNIPRNVTISSFYMDQTEITNQYYRDYLYWLKRVYDVDYPDVALKATPDTLVWLSKLGYNEPYVEYYLRHPAYKNYPVVGVSWLQANDYCSWRTDRVNEVILVREGILKVNPNQTAEDNFKTNVYLAGQYEGLVKTNLEDLNPTQGQGASRKVKMEDGILLPKYRLPTEAEWEFAAAALIGNTQAELTTSRRQYPWNGHIVRNADDRFKGEMMANFTRGKGDMMGVSGKLNDNADITAEVTSYWPNDYGLYNMGGNVSEWVMDVYRPMSPTEVDEFRPFRGNVFKTVKRDETGAIEERDSLGNLKYRDITEAEVESRRNFRKADNMNFNDGDRNSSIYYADEDVDDPKIMYEFGATSMIDNRSRVYKGASWKDRAYFLSQGTRRYLDERYSTNYIGFRCAMARVGSPVGLGKKKKK